MDELNLAEMDDIVADWGGSPRKLPKKKGLKVIRIKSGECLSRIASRYRTTVNYLCLINDSITDPDDITAGYYMYVPA